jgi:hypothetical protein
MLKLSHLRPAPGVSRAYPTSPKVSGSSPKVSGQKGSTQKDVGLDDATRGSKESAVKSPNASKERQRRTIATVETIENIEGSLQFQEGQRASKYSLGKSPSSSGGLKDEGVVSF